MTVGAQVARRATEFETVAAANGGDGVQQVPRTLAKAAWLPSKDVQRCTACRTLFYIHVAQTPLQAVRQRLLQHLRASQSIRRAEGGAGLP